MATTNYALTADESAALDAILGAPPHTTVAAQVATATAALTGLAGAALAAAQARLDRLVAHQSSLTQNAYMDVLTARSPAVVIPAGAAFDRQTIGGTDTIIVTA